MTLLKGFPTSNRISQRRTEKIHTAEDVYHVALVGFASKGPINQPIFLEDTSELRRLFGYPHTEQVTESHLYYAAEQCLNAGARTLICRVADETATTATATIPGSDTVISICSNKPEPYIFHKNQFFRWKLNGVLSGKILVVLGTEEEGLTAKQLSDELNEQLNKKKDGIEFFVHDERYLGVRTTMPLKHSLELVSIQDAMYGPWGVTGLAPEMQPAEKINILSEGCYDLTWKENVGLDVVVNGSRNTNIDGVIQRVNLSALEGKTHKATEIADYINKSQLPLLPGGWRAFADGDNLVFKTNHVGHDASLKIRDNFFGFTSEIAYGKSPLNEGIFHQPRNQTDASLVISADSAGIDGNATKVVISTDEANQTFNIDVWNNGVQVESWGQLSKNKTNKFYIEYFINVVSDWIRVKDNANNPNMPKTGAYSLTGGSDGVPESAVNQDPLIVAGLENFLDDGYSIDFLTVPGHGSIAVVKKLVEVCEKRDNCLGIIDSALGASLIETSLISDIKSDVAAVFWPWVQIRDVHNRMNVWVPPSGSVIAALVKSSPWDSLTNLDKGVLPYVLNVLSEESEMNFDKANSVINTIVHYLGVDAYVINGQKSLSGGNINTPRTLFYIKKRIRKNIDTVTGDGRDFKNKLSLACDEVLSYVKNSRGLHNYSVAVEEVEETTMMKRGCIAVAVIEVQLQPDTKSLSFKTSFPLTRDKKSLML